MLLNLQTHATAAESPYFEARGMKRLSSFSLGVPNGDNGAICAWRSSSSDRLHGAPPLLGLHMTSAQFLDYLEPLPVSVTLRQLIHASFEPLLADVMYVLPPSLATLTTGVACAITICWIGRKEGRGGHQERALHVGQGVQGDIEIN